METQKEYLKILEKYNIKLRTTFKREYATKLYMQVFNRESIKVNIYRNDKKIENFDYDGMKDDIKGYYPLMCYISDAFYLESEGIDTYCEYLKQFDLNDVECKENYKVYKRLKTLKTLLLKFFSDAELESLYNELLELENLE